MTQRSGRTAEEILRLLIEHHTSSYINQDIPRSVFVDRASRQLFNALLEIVGDDIEPDRKFGYSYQDAGKNELRTELRERLAIFFNQSEQK